MSVEIHDITHLFVESWLIPVIAANVYVHWFMVRSLRS
jgi:hypothetical protein